MLTVRGFISALSGFKKQKYLVWSAKAHLVPDSIQSREYSKDGDIDGVSYGTDANGDLNVFNVEHDDDGLWLNSNNGNPNTLYNPDNRFVCLVPRNYPCFSPPSAESFRSWRNQLPSCLPIFTNCLERIAYWVSLITSTSQASRSRNFKESNFLEIDSIIWILSVPFKNTAENSSSDISTVRISIREPSVFLDGVGKWGRIACQNL